MKKVEQLAEAAIEAATPEEEARGYDYGWNQPFRDAYAEGYRKAIEDAAAAADDEFDSWDDEDDASEIDRAVVHARQAVAARIRALPDTEET